MTDSELDKAINIAMGERRSAQPEKHAFQNKDLVWGKIEKQIVNGKPRAWYFQKGLIILFIASIPVIALLLNVSEPVPNKLNLVTTSPKISEIVEMPAKENVADKKSIIVKPKKLTTLIAESPKDVAIQDSIRPKTEVQTQDSLVFEKAATPIVTNSPPLEIGDFRFNNKEDSLKKENEKFLEEYERKNPQRNKNGNLQRKELRFEKKRGKRMLSQYLWNVFRYK